MSESGTVIPVLVACQLCVPYSCVTEVHSFACALWPGSSIGHIAVSPRCIVVPMHFG